MRRRPPISTLFPYTTLFRAKGPFLQRRAVAVANLPEFERLREIGRDIKNHALAHLDHYLERYAEAVERAGGKVHWCSTAEDARAAILKICRDAGRSEERRVGKECR